MSIKSIEHCGVLIHECDQEGERRTDNTVPAHPNGIPVSENRWLLVYATRRFRGNDDDCSIAYQIRADRPDGKLIRESILAKATDDWQEEGLRSDVRYKLLHRQPTAFGVPKGAFINGRQAPHANVFIISWIRVAREYDPVLNYVEGTSLNSEMVNSTQIVQWTQVRLNEAGDDIETIRPIKQLRQSGYESGPAFCSLENVKWTMTYMQAAIPYNKDCTEWVETAIFDACRTAPRKYRYSASEGCYEWVETGPFLSDGKGPHGNVFLIPLKEGWATVRIYCQFEGHVWSGRGLGWTRLPSH